ncbi:hypothetical protein NLI96_g2403 [Meripilus lineatus]|uniref:ATP adenylyltransferase n=1 Tax=Meripilus lineatus TaxID=2056292 RepID=A0AAD5V8N2_9APHY|nr:hypothetical protein NLI96_g2403 [Physisporinus lineatus]
MGNLIWHEFARYVSLTATTYTIWASFWGMLYRKFFWDFAEGILRAPGGIQPSPKVAFLITLIVKAPIIQIFSMFIGIGIVAIEYPLPFFKDTSVARSFAFKAIMLIVQAVFAIMYYQNPAIEAVIIPIDLASYLYLVCSREGAKESRIPWERFVLFTEGLLWHKDRAYLVIRFPKFIKFSFTLIRKSRTVLFDGFGNRKWNKNKEKDTSSDVEGGNHYFSSGEFEIRLCPALQEKPELPAPSLELLAEKERNADKGTKTDPFAPPYIPNLFLGELKDPEENAEYVVLFNKYSVVPHHILLVTKEYPTPEFQSQSSPLFPPDLVQTYQLLLAARAAGRKFFAFYNCGSYSGASQPHKHLQLIPIEDDGPPVERLARAANLEVPDRPFSISALPYANHIRRLPTNLSLSTSPSELSEILSRSFLNLLDLSITTIRHDPSYPPGPPSYNVILTLEHLHIIPRKEETYILEETKEKLSVNALGFAGMLLVKCEEELQAVRKEGVGKILRGVGLESVHEIQVSQDDDRLANL